MQERKDALSRRKEDILRAVVEAYIAAGEPVGSKGLAESLGVSSATIRNEMADLSTRGLLEQPHTSAGRTPTDTGYRKPNKPFPPHLMFGHGIPSQQ